MSFVMTIMTRAAAERDGRKVEPLPLMGLIEPDDDEMPSWEVWFLSEVGVRQMLASCPPRKLLFRCGPDEDVGVLKARIRSATLH